MATNVGITVIMQLCTCALQKSHGLSAGANFFFKLLFSRSIIAILGMIISICMISIGMELMNSAAGSTEYSSVNLGKMN